MTDQTTVRAAQWRELEAALQPLTLAQFEYERGCAEDARVHVDDVRRALGALALLLADTPDAVGYARLLDAVLTPPSHDGRGCLHREERP